MNNKLLALAVGSALGLAPVVAPQAKVTVYGHAQVEISNQDVNGSDTNKVTDEARGRLGVKASEKLGNGMTAIAKFEWKIDTTQGGAATGQRESFVGVKGNFGTIELGNLKSAYKYSGGVGYDAFVATTLEARNNGGMSGSTLGSKAFGHNGFLANSIGYKSANFNGLSFWGTYSPDENGSLTGADGNYSFGLNYRNGPFEVGVAGVSNDAITNVGVDSNGDPIENSASGEGIKVYGKYKFGNHTFLGQFETLEPNGSPDVEVWFGGYQMKMGNNTLVFQTGNTDFGSNTADVDYYTIGAIHNLSKKTRLFGGYRNTEQGSSETEVLSIGLRMIF